MDEAGARGVGVPGRLGCQEPGRWHRRAATSVSAGGSAVVFNTHLTKDLNAWKILEPPGMCKSVMLYA